MSRSGIHFGSRRGQAALFVVLSLSVLLGVLGLAVDLGSAYYKRLQMQSAADAAAMAAVTFASAPGGAIVCGQNNVTCGSTKTCDATAGTTVSGGSTVVATTQDTFSTGCLYAAANGFVNNSSNNVSVSITGNSGTAQAPPGTSGYTPTYWAQANISTSPFNLFGPIGGLSRFTINVSSIAAVSYYSGGACIYALDATASGAFSAQGSTNVTAACGIFVNSNSSTAFVIKGGANVSSTQILVNGGTSIANNGVVSPTPRTQAGSQTDPLAGVTMPTVPNSCDYTNYSFNSGTGTTLSPGTYCGGITIAGGVVTFSPGLYILNGGGLTVTGNPTIRGTGVTIFNTGQYGHTIAAISTAGTASLNLAAPTSDPWKGMLILQDPNLTYGGSNNISGTSGSVYQGTLYFPTTAVNYAGTSTSGAYTALIGKTINFTGNSVFNNDPSGYYTGLGTTVRGIIQ